MIITQATVNDIPGILKLLSENHVDNIVDKSDGFVTTNMTPEQLSTLITKENGVTVAKVDEKILAFAMAGSWEFWSEWPFFQYMIEQLPKFSLNGDIIIVKNSYQYGPVCVDKSVRGTGVFEKVFFHSLDSMKKRYPIMVTFVNKVNLRSLSAHTKKQIWKFSESFRIITIITVF